MRGLQPELWGMPSSMHAVNVLPFELWREEGVIRLVLSRGARIDICALKELLRVLGAVDPTGRAPVLVEEEDRVEFNEQARDMLRRISKSGGGRPVAVMAYDLTGRVQGGMLAHYFSGSFPMRTFAWREEAMRWIDGWMRSPELRVVR